jgi:hypothetical protein
MQHVHYANPGRGTVTSVLRKRDSPGNFAKQVIDKNPCKLMTYCTHMFSKFGVLDK